MVGILQKTSTELNNMTLEQYYLMHKGRLMKMAIAFTKQDAEDLLQSAMLKAFLYFDSLDGDFFKWFYSIIRNVYYDTKRVTQMDLSEAEEMISEINPENIILEKESILKVREGLKELREKDREVLYLFYFKEFSCTQIAKKFNISLGTVQSRLFTARNNLKTLLEVCDGL